MPLLLVALLLLPLLILVLVVLIPIGMFTRYRAGTARRQARRWLASVNLAGFTLSSVLFLAGAAVANIWVPQALVHAVSGLLLGAVLGGVGLLLTRWDVAGGAWFYTPNRWLVLVISLAVAARLAYGFWRSWQAWRSMAGHSDWVAAAGVAASLAAGAVILGYYLVYWWGIRQKT